MHIQRTQINRPDSTTATCCGMPEDYRGTVLVVSLFRRVAGKLVWLFVSFDLEEQGQRPEQAQFREQHEGPRRTLLLVRIDCRIAADAPGEDAQSDGQVRRSENEPCHFRSSRANARRGARFPAETQNRHAAQRAIVSRSHAYGSIVAGWGGRAKGKSGRRRVNAVARRSRDRWSVNA